MFPQQPQQQFRTAGADVQIFYGSNSSSWLKPRGVSHVYILLIGRGGDGDTAGTGGGSGAVTVWYGAAQNVPDSLFVSLSGNTIVTARFSNSSQIPTALLTASNASGPTGGSAMTANQFTTSGFFQSVAGQAGAAGTQSASTTTFLSGGTSSSQLLNANYGYTQLASGSGGGYFMLQPIILGIGASGTNTGGIGCGGGDNGLGGRGMVLIASW